MTRKDYILIAAALNSVRPHNHDFSDVVKCDAHAHAVAEALAQDNPRFDRARFLTACGVA